MEGPAASPAIAPDDPRLERCGFAKLQGEGIEIFVRKYEIIMGRSGKNCTLDVVLGENTAISRQHAAIRYNFESKCFELVVMGKNGVSVESATTGALVMYTPQSPPQPLRSKDLIIVADKRFYFLLPRSLGGHRSKRRKIEQQGQGQGQPAAPQGSAPPQAPAQAAAVPTAPQDPAHPPAPMPAGDPAGPTATPAEATQQEGTAPPAQEQQKEPEAEPQQLLPPPSPPPGAPDDDPLADANALPYANGLMGGDDMPGMV